MSLDILRLNERIELALQLGESHFREFKSGFQGPPDKKAPRPIKDICVDIAETLVAFANADGGELIVGVEDDGTATGVQVDEENLQTLLNAPNVYVHKDTPLPSPRATKFIHHDKLLIYFSVPKGTDLIHLTSNGRCLQRKDRESVPIATESIRFNRTEITSREYDRVFVDAADIGDLDTLLVSQVAEHVSKGMSIEKCLQHLELAEFDGARFRLRRAALLLFAKQPSKWHPRLQTRVLKISGTEMKTGEQFNVVFDDERSDNIITLLESSWDLLRPHLTETRFSKDALFKSQILYPELACREALVNAIAHRDYSIEGRGIEVRVYTDRLEIDSPGGLLSSIKIDDLRNLKGVHQSRNSHVARVLREVGYMRELGEGMKRIYELMKSNDLTPPEIIADNNSFKITLHHKYIYSKEQKLWLEGFARFDLSREQAGLVLLGYNGHVISPQEIFDALGIVDTDHYRALLDSLYKLGILSRSVTRSAALAIAKKKRISKKRVPQFIIQIPSAERPVQAKPESVDVSEYAKVYVVNIPYDTKELELEELFGQFGEVENVAIPINRETGLSRGFAFVEFDRTQSANKALESSGRLRLKTRTLYVQEFRPKKS